MFIGRENELKLLNDRYRSPNAEFAVLYGRRRVGKTELLRHFSLDKDAFFYTCNEYTDSRQFEKFKDALCDFDPAFIKKARGLRDWDELFRSLPELRHKGKLIVVIDEFPYMCAGDKSIPSVLQNAWDSVLKYSEIMLIISGSSISFTEDELLAAKNPLYGRATVIYKLLPLPFSDAVKFFPDYSAEDKVMAYAILGGIPHYLKQFSPDLSLMENIIKNILTKGTALYGEVEYILHQELREPTVYSTILEVIATGANKYNEIAQKARLDSGKLNFYLKGLLELGLVQKELPAAATDKELANRSAGEYRVCDNYFRFWFAFCYGNITELEKGGAQELWDYEIENELHRFCSRAFEEVCTDWLRAERKAGRAPFPFLNIGRWWGNVRHTDETGKPFTSTEEIDILAYNKDKTACIIGECKFRNSPFDHDQLLRLRKKLDLRGVEAYYYLFSLSGFTAAVSNEENEHLMLVPIDKITNIS